MPGGHLTTALHDRVMRQALAVLTALACYCPLSWAQQELPSEQALRTAMVFNFLRFTEFPTETIALNGVIRICAESQDKQQLEALAKLSGRKIGSHTLVVNKRASKPGNCDVLYTDESPFESWTVHESARLLTIGTHPGFAKEGGMIEITVRPEGARFEVNLKESQRAGLRFMPQMLRLAHRVYE